MRWQYLVEIVPSDALLNHLMAYGGLGWELVQVGPINGLNREVIMKRQAK